MHDKWPLVCLTVSSGHKERAFLFSLPLLPPLHRPLLMTREYEWMKWEKERKRESEWVSRWVGGRGEMDEATVLKWVTPFTSFKAQHEDRSTSTRNYNDLLNENCFGTWPLERQRERLFLTPHTPQKERKVEGRMREYTQSSFLAWFSQSVLLY